MHLHGYHACHLLWHTESMHRNARRDAQPWVLLLQDVDVCAFGPCSVIFVRFLPNFYVEGTYREFGVGIMPVAPIMAGETCAACISTYMSGTPPGTTALTILTVIPSAASTVARFFPIEQRAPFDAA